MKIAYIIDSITALGGIERVTLSKANALADINGNIIYIIVVNNNGIPVLPLNLKIRVINLEVNYNDARGLSRINSELVFRRKRSEHKLKLINKLNEIQPDIVISTGMAEKHFIRTMNLIYDPVLIKEIHFSSDFRMIEAKLLKEKIYARIAQFLDNNLNIKSFDAVIVLTEEDRKRNWKRNERVKVIPNPITMVSTYPSSKVNDKRVIAAGRLVRQKNFSSLIRAWKIVVDKYPNWVLDIYGEGYLKNSLERLSHDLGLSENVFLQGRTNDVFSKMSSSSIYVLSSLYEGFALVLIEAMSCGLPVVSYACPCGPKDIIEEGKDGFLVPVNDEQTLADRIIRLIEDEELRRQMSKAALQKSEKYRMDKIIPMWMNLFEELLQEKRAKG